MIRALPGQLYLPECPDDFRDMARRRADAPLRPKAPQMPMDVGLFADSLDQLDLVEMLQDPTNEE